jgi:hypothetical protein
MKPSNSRLRELKISRAFFLFIALAIVSVEVFFETVVAHEIVFNRLILYPGLALGLAISLLLAKLVNDDIRRYKKDL